MAYARAFANSVILPDGQVFITGGQAHAVPFSDDTAQMVPEMWNPTSQNFTPMAPLSIPRNYHSTAVLVRCTLSQPHHPRLPLPRIQNVADRRISLPG